jgi:hypothetical protein
VWRLYCEWSVASASAHRATLILLVLSVGYGDQLTSVRYTVRVRQEVIVGSEHRYSADADVTTGDPQSGRRELAVYEEKRE